MEDGHVTRKMTKKEESRLDALVSGLEFQAEDQIVQQSIRFSWIRRRVVEGGYHGSGGWTKTTGNQFDLWLEDAPGDPARAPDRVESGEHAAARALLDYELRVRLD